MNRIDAFSLCGSERYTHSDGRDYTRTLRCVIVAVDIEDAIRAFKAAHRDGKVYSVGHRGEIEIITSEATRTAEGQQP